MAEGVGTHQAASSHKEKTGSDNACATKTFIANFRPMKLSRNWLCFLCVLILSSVPNAWSQDAADSESVRPSGISGPVRKAKAVTAKENEDADVETTPARKAKTSKELMPARTGRTQSRRKHRNQSLRRPITLPKAYQRPVRLQ